LEFENQSRNSDANSSSSSQAVQIQGGNVIIVTRVRPLNKKEIEMGTQICLDFHPNKKEITLKLT
jgi:hypothetical protein